MSRMIERVANAISAKADERGHPVSRLVVYHLAEAAICAMREPTEAMDAAARDECNKMAGCIDPVIHIWDRMLDTALTEPCL